MVPHFSGDIQKWLSVKKLFLNLISDQPSVNSNTFKNQLLFQGLLGEAKNMVENMRNSLFDEIWKLLMSHYGDPFGRANSYFKQLFRNKNNGMGMTLRQRLVTYRQHTSDIKLAYSELKLDLFEQIMISHFSSNVETRPSLRLGWQCRVIDKTESCTLGEFLQFLE